LKQILWESMVDSDTEEPVDWVAVVGGLDWSFLSWRLIIFVRVGDQCH